MKMSSILKSAVACVAMAGFALAPLTAFAEGDHDHGQKHEHGRGHDDKHQNHWNPAPPKKNGRHDNRDWNKGRNGQGEDRRDDSNFQRNRSRSNLPTFRQNDVAHRQQTKNEWRNLATAAGLVGVLGLLKHDSTLTFAGAAGALYSAYRYEQDRKSQSSMQRGRAYYFSQPYFYRDGQRFDRRTVTRNGQRYYQFTRG